MGLGPEGSSAEGSRCKAREESARVGVLRRYVRASGLSVPNSNRLLKGGGW